MRLTPADTGSRPPSRAGLALALVLVQLLFGVHYYAAKRVVSVVPPAGWAALRVTAAAVILLPLALAVAGRGALPGRRDLARLAALSILGVAINQLCFVEGLSRTTLSHSSLITAGIPVTTLLLALLLRHESARPAKLASIGMALVGVLTLLEVDRLTWTRATGGDLLTLVTALSFSLFLVLARPVLARVDALVATGLLFAFGSLPLLPLGIVSLVSSGWSAWPAWVWGWAAYIVVGATVVAYTLNSMALRHVESSFVALFVFLQPLLASALDVAVLGSPWTPRLTAAGGFILGGVVLAIVAGRRRRATPLPQGT